MEENVKNSKITHKITQGMYVLTTAGGGCVVDAVSRVSAGDQPLISVAIAKTNCSHQLLSNNTKFALSVLGEDSDPEIIETFGFKKSTECDKLAKVATETIAGVEVVKDSLGYMICEKVDAIDMDTHTLYIGRMVEGDVFRDADPMSYAYYQAHKSELIKQGPDHADTSSDQDELSAKTTAQGKTAWVCKVCGYVYYGDTVPDDYKCPLCGLGKAYFVKQD